MRVPVQRCARAQSCQCRVHTYASHTCTHDSPWALDTQADTQADSAQGRNHSFSGLLAARDSPAPPPPPPCARPRRTPRPPPPVSPRSAPGPRSFPGRLARTSRAGDRAGARGLRSRLSAAGGRAPSCGSSGPRPWPGGGGPEVVARAGGRRAAGPGLRPAASERACRQHGGAAGQAGLRAPAAGAVHAGLLPDATSQRQEAPQDAPLPAQLLLHQGHRLLCRLQGSAQEPALRGHLSVSVLPWLGRWGSGERERGKSPLRVGGEHPCSPSTKEDSRDPQDWRFTASAGQGVP